MMRTGHWAAATDRLPPPPHSHGDSSEALSMDVHALSNNAPPLHSSSPLCSMKTLLAYSIIMDKHFQDLQAYVMHWQWFLTPHPSAWHHLVQYNSTDITSLLNSSDVTVPPRNLTKIGKCKFIRNSHVSWTDNLNF